MIIEYFIDKEEYKKHLKEINFTASNNVHISKRSWQQKGKENYLLRLTSKVEGRKGAKALCEVNARVLGMLNEKQCVFRLLINQASQYYVKELYPLVCEFETKLRKFIQSVLFDLNEKAEVEVCKKLKKADIIKEEKQTALNCNFLEYAELGDIMEFLFANDELYKEVDGYKKKEENRFKTREELIEFIKNSEKKTIWDEFFAKDFSDSILPKRLQEIKDFRNDVMHFHEIDDEHYEKAKGILQEGIADLDKQIKKGIVIEITEAKVATLSNNPSYFGGVLQVLSAVTKYWSLNREKILGNVTNTLKLFSNSMAPYTAALESIRKTQEYLGSITKFTPIVPPMLLGDTSETDLEDEKNEEAAVEEDIAVADSPQDIEENIEEGE